VLAVTLKKGVGVAMTLSEQETIILFDEAGGEAQVYTASKRVADLLARRGLEPYKTDANKQQITGWFFKLPKQTVILKPGKYSIRIGGTKINSIPSSDTIIAKSGGVSG
jgi:hypothetical protein